MRLTQFFIALATVSVISTANSYAATRTCSLQESTASINARIKNLKLKKGQKKLASQVITIRSCKRITAAAITYPALVSLNLVDATSDKIVSSVAVKSTDVVLNMPSNIQNNATVEAVFAGSIPGGVKMILGNIASTREKGAPFALFGNEGNDFYGKKLPADTRYFEIRACSSQADNNCQKVFKGSLTFKLGKPIATPTPGTVATPIPVATKTPSATATPVETPLATIDTLNNVENGVIVGEVPLSVFVKGITTYRDLKGFDACEKIVIPKSVDNWSYVAIGAPNRAEYEAKGDEKMHCYDNLDSELYRINGQGLKYHGTFMNAVYKWNFGDATQYSVFNEIEGWNAAHTYDVVGTYSLRLEVTDSMGRKGFKTIAVKVNPSTRRPVYVSQYGNDANDGKSPERPIKSFGMIRQLTYGKSDIDLLFKRGETFIVTAADEGIEFNKSNIRVSSYGTGDFPTLKRGGTVLGNSAMIRANHLSSAVTIENLRFDTDVVSLYGSDTYHEQTNMPVGVSNSGTRVTVRNNEVLRVGYFISNLTVPSCVDKICVSKKSEGFLAVKNVNPIPDGLRAYFVWNEGYQTNLFGNTVENSLREHIFRNASGYEMINAQYNYFRNTAIGNGDTTDFRKSTINLQKGGLVFIAHNILAEGESIINPLASDRGTRGERTRFVRYTGNKFEARPKYGTGQGGIALHIGDGVTHMSVTNNMFELSNGVSVSTFDTAIVIDGINTDYNRTPTDILIAHNTMSTPANATSRKFINMRDTASGLVILNNLEAHPNADAGSYTDPAINIQASDSVAVSGQVGGIQQIGCNTFPVPATYRNKGAFNPAIHGFNVIGGTWLTFQRWEEIFSKYRGNNSKKDSFQDIEVDRIDQTAIPRESGRAAIQCPPVEGVQTDFFGTVRTGSTVTAGAYEFVK